MRPGSVQGSPILDGDARSPDSLIEAVERLAETMASQRQWMTAREAAEFLRYPKPTFDALAASGKIPRHKRGAGWRYHAGELTKWLMAG